LEVLAIACTGLDELLHVRERQAALLLVVQISGVVPLEVRWSTRDRV